MFHHIRKGRNATGKYRLVFLSQGPRFEASSSVFRLLQGFACTDVRLREHCEFIHMPLKQLSWSQQLPHPELTRQAYETAKQVLASRPNMLALSLYCWNTANLLAVAGLCKQLHPDLKIVAGGPDTFGEGANVLSTSPFLDVVIDGEGELGFRSLLQHYVLGEEALANVPFATFRDGETIVKNANRDYLENLDDIPSPILGRSVDELSTRFYKDEQRAVILETARGCPVACAFCQYPKSGRPMRYFSIERVLEELDYLRAIGLSQVYFGDGIFTIKKERAAQIFDYFLEVFVEGTLHVELKVDMLPPDLLGRCHELFAQGRLSAGVGLQSINDETLRNMGRPTKKHLLVKNVAALDRAAQLRWDLIYGLPGDTFSDVLNGLDFVHSLAPGAKVALQPLQVLPGTQYRASARQLGLVYDPVAPYEVLESNTFSALDMSKAKALEVTLRGYMDDALRLTQRTAAEPLSFRKLFSERYFDYVDVYGWDDQLAHCYFFGEWLRAHVLRVGSPIADLISEAIDFVILQRASQASVREAAWLALPSRVLSIGSETEATADVYRFCHYRPDLEELAGENDAEAIYFALQGDELGLLSEEDCRSLHTHPKENGASATPQTIPEGVTNERRSDQLVEAKSVV